MRARSIIWTDVDGVLSADPRRVPDAQVIDSLSYNEAMELAYFGAKVIHPQTMAPAVGRDDPDLDPQHLRAGEARHADLRAPDLDAAGQGHHQHRQASRCVNLEGAGMIGVPGTAQRLFGALREEGISVILISQGSSEHSICCAIPAAQADARRRGARARLRARARRRARSRASRSRGDLRDPRRGRRRHGRHARRRGARCSARSGAAGVNVRAIAQGASERNISVVIDGQATPRARCARCTRASTSRRTRSRSA